jgi:hypothetical protein
MLIKMFVNGINAMSVNAFIPWQDGFLISFKLLNCIYNVFIIKYINIWGHNKRV